jgi:hypothetical protein
LSPNPREPANDQGPCTVTSTGDLHPLHRCHRSDTGANAAGKTSQGETASLQHWSKDTSQNGWPVLGKDKIEHLTIEGSGHRIAVASGPAAIVLLHVLRRFNYEIDELAAGDARGWRKQGKVTAPYESNYLSGTAVEIRPNLYPAGSSGNIFAPQIALIRDILLDCEGVVRWGGDDPTQPKEGHFQIDVPPASGDLKRVAAKFERWQLTPAAGPGTPVDPFVGNRRKAATNLQKHQRATAPRP